MKSLFTFFLLLCCCVMIVIPTGCDILTQAPPATGPSFGNDLVINEVFSISPSCLTIILGWKFIMLHCPVIPETAFVNSIHLTSLRMRTSPEQMEPCFLPPIAGNRGKV